MIPVATLDAAMLLAETPEMPLHNVGVLIFDPPASPTTRPFDAMTAMIASRLHRVPAFRRKLVLGPYGLGDLHWTDDPHFDLTRHLRRVRLPSPGGPEALTTLVGESAARLLPRDRALWEIVLVEGLASGELAAIAKIHHAAMDGSKLAALIGDLFDREPTEVHSATTPPAWKAEREPGRLRVALAGARTLAEKPGKVLRAAVDVARALRRSRASTLAEPGEMRSKTFRIPPTPWGGALTVRRSAAFASVALDDVRAIGAAFDTTINDVVLAASASALRSWLAAYDAYPTRPLVANVPVALGDAGDEAGNHVSMLRVHLPMEPLDPVTRLARIHEETRRGKRTHRSSGANTYRRLADLVLGITVPRALAAAVSFYARHRGADYHPAFWNVVISNVPGPRVPSYCGGARLKCIHPLGPVQHGSGLNLTVMSTSDRLGLGVLACTDQVPHVDVIATAFVSEIEALSAAARRRSGALR